MVSAATIKISPRQLLKALGSLSYVDYSGQVLSDIPLDALHAVFIGRGNDPSLKCPSDLTGFIELTQGDPGVDFVAEVVFAYAPEAIANGRGEEIFDGACPASLLGEQAKLVFSNCGSAPITVAIDGGTADVEFATDLGAPQEPTIDVNAIVLQTEEKIRPMPRRIDLTRWTTQDPLTEAGDRRKIEQLILLAEATGEFSPTTEVPVVLGVHTSTSTLAVKMDGDLLVDGPAADMLRVQSYVRRDALQATELAISTAAAKFARDPSVAQFVGEMAQLVEPQAATRATQRPACIEMKVQGLKSIETSHPAMLIAEVTRLLTPREADSWAEKEGITPAQRADVRTVADGQSIKTKNLTPSEAIGVATRVGSATEKRG